MKKNISKAQMFHAGVILHWRNGGESRGKVRGSSIVPLLKQIQLLQIIN